MTADKYVPSEADFRDAYRAGREVLALDFGEGGDERADAELHAFLARVRRDAEAAVLREAAEYMNDDQDAQYLVDCARDIEETP